MRLKVSHWIDLLFGSALISFGILCTFEITLTPSTLGYPTWLAWIGIIGMFVFGVGAILVGLEGWEWEKKK
ncbi:MAG TPA: hypothetical protein VEP90_24655 [Methylomirabilota bacterium]|nr:hypothetical protein [Methylomirabilota bacterium]